MNIYQKKLQYIELPCGQGKSTLMTSIIKSNPDKHYLVVVPSKQLQRQSRENIGTGLVINSDTHRDLLETIVKHLRSKVQRVLYITDKMLWRIDDLSLLKNWTVFLDDIVDYFTNDDSRISIKDGSLPAQLYAQIFDLVGYQSGFARVKLSEKELSEDLKTIRDRYKQFEYYNNICINEEVFLKDDCKHLYIIGYHDLFKYADAGIDMIFMAANFTQSLLYKKYYKLFTEYNHGIVPNTTNNSRLTIKYFMKNRKLSAKLLKDHPVVACKIGKYINSQNHTELLWTCNEKRIDEWGVSGNYITPCQRGINDYTDYTVAAFLGSMKINPVMGELIESLLGHSGTDIVQQREYEACYQFIYRTNIRDYSSTDTIVLYVADEVTAYSIPGANYEFVDIGVDIVAGESGRPVSCIDKKTRDAFYKWAVLDPKKKSSQKRAFTKVKSWINNEKKGFTDEQKTKLFDLYNNWVS